MNSNHTKICTPPSRIVVFASGRGTNFGALIKAQKLKQLKVNIVGLVTNVEDCGAQKLARQNEIPVICVPHQKYRTRTDHEAAILSQMDKEWGLQFSKDAGLWAVLAGYMRLFSPQWIDYLSRPELRASRMVNIHPSLLPSFRGGQGYKQALEYGVDFTGVTLHLVTAGLDDGPIICQKTISIAVDETENSLQEKGLQIEHELLISTLNDLATKNWVVEPRIQGGRPRVQWQ